MSVERQRIDYSDLDLWDELDTQLSSRPCSGLPEFDVEDDDGRSLGSADFFAVDVAVEGPED